MSTTPAPTSATGAGAPVAPRTDGFGVRLAAAMADAGPVCVGIDPHASLLTRWGLPVDASGAREMGLRVVEEVAGSAAALKPQSAFFEVFGPEGVAALQEVLLAARSAGILTVLDVKRGDIGTTMDAYARTHLAGDSPMPADAITVSPYLGPDSLSPTVELARQHGRGVFALALTSNPEGGRLQHVGGAGASVAGTVVDWAAATNAATGETPGPVGLVVGATIGSAVRDLGVDLSAAGGVMLAPGIGAQGAGAAELRDVFGDARDRVLASASRSVLGAGPERGAVRAAARATVDEVRAALA
jgi:orotidine-5'-phosphate decarboxylase